MASSDLAGDLRALLGGQGLPVLDYDSVPLKVSPVPVQLRKNVSYIVLAVFFNDQGEVLMIQEAKRECHGSWYLPAGRMEPGETILEALRREVKEEAGLECEPLTLLAVEERGPRWIRFAFLARPTGGILKTSEEADKESLQAGWYPQASLPTPLRSHDILPLIKLGSHYYQRAKHPPTLPQELPCKLICQRLITAFTSAKNIWVLAGTQGSLHLPITACGLTPSEQNSSIVVSVFRLLQQCLTLSQLTVKTQGILGLQHLGKNQADGICLNVLVTVAYKNPGSLNKPPEIQGSNFCWWQVEEEDVRSHLLKRLHEVSVVPIHS
ncbi:8-oxo-dGDP phosphatase NUDT18 [Dromiciops gliroides]|uniref:8-oxo-dGDP phosphatase NUDT18 n=1 Tax=Dromiciops gliroides TaxID=33562 RepID=UPI001CC4E7B9|nr:8-oxo-dGDP phosphatase NUDT18 [Dromiciops gliroides]